MGGAFIKFGQLLSTRADLLPKAYVLELMDLFDNVKQFPYQEVRRIFHSELGITPEKLFKDIQKEPFASASFGQVHAAKLEEDTIVAVKIMRPGIEDDVFIDFIFLRVMAKLTDTFFTIKAFQWQELVNEFIKWTKEELDYHIEAERAEKLYRTMTSESKVIIPKTYHKLSTKKILVQQYIRGIPLSRIIKGLRDGRLSVEEVEKMGLNIKNFADILVEDLLRQYFFFGYFHADPHPGNILLLKNGKIALVDFGMVSEEKIPNQEEFIKFVKPGVWLQWEEACYHFMQFAGNETRQLIESALPPNVDQKIIDGFMEEMGKQLAKSTINKMHQTVSDLEKLKNSWTIAAIQVFRSLEGYKIKIPQEVIIFARTMIIIDNIAREVEPMYKIGLPIDKFFKKYPEDDFLKNETVIPYKRIPRERAVEQLNNWLSYLFEKDPNLYRLVKAYLKRYTPPRS